MKDWKPARFQSFETIRLINTKQNPVMRPCGFKANGRPRVIKETCLISRMRKICLLKEKPIKLCVCITMYNEQEKELIDTLTGVLQNYNAMYMDDEVALRQEDIMVVVVCDGYDQVPKSFRDYITKHQLFDEQILRERGFMK